MSVLDKRKVSCGAKNLSIMNQQAFKISVAVICLLIQHEMTFACEQKTHAHYDESKYYLGISTSMSSTELRQALNRRIKDHTTYSYTPCVWQILVEADRDPSNTNNIIGIYTRRSIPIINRDRGKNTPDAWNREHIWPKSHGFSNREQHAHNDVHALFASDKSVNSDRGNLDFGIATHPHQECKECRFGNGVWEPPNEVKGDIARAMFYMDVRYEGNDSSGVQDLMLVNKATSRGLPTLGKLCTLLQWHVDDPVSNNEEARHNIVFSWQGNRNPFIDHPEFAEHLYSDQCSAGSANSETEVGTETDFSKSIFTIIFLASVFGALVFRYNIGRQ